MLYRIRCVVERKLFPPVKEDELGFTICAYRALDISELPADAQSARFVAKGPLLPCSPHSAIVLIGDRWEKKGEEYTLNCIDYEETIPNTITAVSGFLETLCGCEKKDVCRIMNNTPGNNPLAAISDDGSIIRKSVKNKYAAEKIYNSCFLRREKKSAFFYVLPFLPKKCPAQVAADVAVQAEGVDEIRQNPFKFVIEGVLPYRTGKAIAKENKVPLDGMEGVQAAIIDVLKQGEGLSAGDAYDNEETVGNTFTTIEELQRKVGNVVGINKSAPIIWDALDALLKEGHCTCAQGQYIYRKATSDAEYGIAREILRLMSCEVSSRDYKLDIYGLENKKQMRLAPEQRNAVKVALANPVTLLIGGPGTGKTTIEQFVIEVYRMYHDAPILLVAPTGKAARRMSESTGEPACTVHKALGVLADAEVISTDTILDAGLVIVDEGSMLDAQVSFALLKAIPQGAQVVIVGDTNQLPSVSAGNVLFELINSKAVPVAALETVYRQKAGSTIAINCARIKRGGEELEYSDTFRFVEAESQEDAVNKIIEAYQGELAAGLGTENICLLSPYRRTTPTGVNQLNKQLQEILVEAETPSLTYGAKTFYLGDKVMMMANREDVANGDVGYITEIDPSRKKFSVDFGDGVPRAYPKSDLRHFDLAYGISIHKSQGAEFDTCIIVMMDEHKTMLKRNLIYTAISRAKKKVILVGSKLALRTAILTEDVTKRQSRLGSIIAAMAEN